MSLIKIIPYQEIYKQQIINLILDIQVREFNLAVTLQDQPDLEKISSFYQSNKGNFWLAISNHKVIGTISLIDIGNSQSALRKMFVAKDYRGKEKNVAQQLLQTLFTWCKLKNINEIYLGTISIYLAAEHFYKKNNFYEISKQDLPKNFPIMKVDNKFYCCNNF